MLMATSVQVTTAPREAERPPNTPRAERVLWLPARMHSTHCCPTAADRRQSGHAGRPQRTQDTYVSRPGCLKQVGGPASPGPLPVPPGPGLGLLISLSRLSRPLRALHPLE